MVAEVAVVAAAAVEAEGQGKSDGLQGSEAGAGILEGGLLFRYHTGIQLHKEATDRVA